MSSNPSGPLLMFTNSHSHPRRRDLGRLALDLVAAFTRLHWPRHLSGVTGVGGRVSLLETVPSRTWLLAIGTKGMEEVVSVTMAFDEQRQAIGRLKDSRTSTSVACGLLAFAS